MSDVAKFFGDMVGGFGDVAQAGWRFYGDASQFLTGSRGIAPIQPIKSVISGSVKSPIRKAFAVLNSKRSCLDFP